MTSLAAIDERIRELVEAHRPELEHLVDEEVDRQLAELVAARLNGNGRNTPAAEATTSSAPKTCNVCGLEKPASEFETNRRTCRACRRRQERERAHRRAEPEPGPEPPRPESLALSSPGREN